MACFKSHSIHHLPFTLFVPFFWLRNLPHTPVQPHTHVNPKSSPFFHRPPHPPMSNPYGKFSKPTISSSKSGILPGNASKPTSSFPFKLPSLSLIRRGLPPLTTTQSVLSPIYLTLFLLTLTSSFLPSSPRENSLPPVLRPALILLSLSHLSYAWLVYTAPFSLNDSFYYLVGSMGKHQLTKR